MLKELIGSIISISMLMFGSYQGNTPVFSELIFAPGNTEMVISTKLEKAFENDFETVFKSGRKISVYFDVQIANANEETFNDQFRHCVKFNPIEQSYALDLEEQAKSIVLSNYQEVLDEMCKIAYPLTDAVPTGNLNVTLEAHLKSINLESLGKKFDLMTLWRFHVPKTEVSIIREI